jgi:hypothetical protein
LEGEFLTQKSSIKYTWGSKTMRLRMGSFGTPKNSINHTGKAKL